ILLALFADLIVSRGRVPNYQDLSDGERVQFRQHWNSESLDARDHALTSLQVTDTARRQLAAPVENDGEPAGNQAVPWKAYVGLLLERRAGEDLAGAYRARAGTGADLVDGAELERVRLGIAGQIVRSRDTVISHAVGWVTRWNPWMWKPSESGHPNQPYLVGL